jgi:cell division protein FtsI/penicillin-binding protein 2
MSNKRYFKRAAAVFVVFFILFSLLWWKLKLNAIDQSGELRVWMDSQFTERVEISDTKYIIFDQAGKQMMDYKNKYYAVVDPLSFSRNSDNDDDLFALTYILRNYNSKYNLFDLGLGKTTAKLRFEIDESTYKKLKNIKNVKGFYTYVYSETNRLEAWKVENMLSTVRDPANNSMKADNSLEMEIYRKTEQNDAPKIIFNKDLDGNITPQEFNPPSKNINVRLTIDKNIQDRIKEVLNSDKYLGFNQVGVVLMESSTGKIRAMTQKDDSQPNVNLGSKSEGFDPGSIFKVIVEETGLENNVLNLNTKYQCKSDIYKGIYDKCPEHDHGTLTISEALIVSCNNVFAQIGDKVGVNNFLSTAKKQGMFDKVLNFDSEAKGTVALPKNGEGAGQLAIGQSMSITPIQAISISNTVANSGIYVKPYLIEAYVDNNNQPLEILKTEQHQVVNRSNASILKNQMIKVVSEGTAAAAKIPDIEIGGKTGTSTRFDGAKKTSDGWFAGFFKLNNKYYSMIVFVKDIHTQNDQAATTAVPIFKDIVLALNSYMQK